MIEFLTTSNLKDVQSSVKSLYPSPMVRFPFHTSSQFAISLTDRPFGWVTHIFSQASHSASLHSHSTCHVTLKTYVFGNPPGAS